MSPDPSFKRALIIDDDDHIRELLQTLLETAGFEVETLRDGIDAVELKKDYHVVLLDMKMPIFEAGRLTVYWRMTDPSIRAPEWTVTSGERMEVRTVPPETMVPAHSIESNAWPRRWSSSNTNLAGGAAEFQE